VLVSSVVGCLPPTCQLLLHALLGDWTAAPDGAGSWYTVHCGTTHGMLQDGVGWREPAIGMCTGKGSAGSHLSVRIYFKAMSSIQFLPVLT